jgi:hypothetical protein
MDDRPTKAEREAMIAGEPPAALTPEQTAEVPLLADLLADPSTWAEPRAGLADSVVAAVLAAEPVATAPTPITTRRRPPPRRWWLAASVAAGIAVVAGSVVANRGGTASDFEGELAATDLSPGAHGSVEVTRNPGGFRVTLDASGLPPLPTGGFYQAWLKDPTGSLVPIGTFSSSDETVTLWSGVSPEDFPLLTVTVEDLDGDQASSGRVVLAGEVSQG